MNWLSTLVGLPDATLKAIAGGVGTAAAAAAWYVWRRVAEARKPDPSPATATVPRIALSPEDRDLVFTVIRTGTDLTRGLASHADALQAHAARVTAPPPKPPRQRAPRTSR